ncbi:MAG: hypothetical protein E7602_06065 [Ruminococcaceae bacterium]|nr:hypothetical protein [Oscillospiraceae bacterium]
MKKEKQTESNGAKTFWWFKLRNNFFDDDKIKLLEKAPNGEKYIVFLFKLICKSIKTEGLLRYSEKLPYSPQMLADITNTDIDVVRSALVAFDELELVEVYKDGTYFIELVPNNTGKESESAARMRRIRKKQQENLLPSHCAHIVQHCDVEKEKDKELELDIEYNNSAHTREENPVENSLDTTLKYRDVATKTGAAYLFISDAQLADLQARFSEETLGYYLNKIAELNMNEYKYGCCDYEQLLRLEEQDRKVRQNE